MAPTATANRARTAPAPSRAPARRVPMRVVEPRRRAPSRPRRAPIVVALVVSVGSLLLVAAAQAYLTQGQVRLARLQQQLASEQANHRDLELQVAKLEEPSQVVTRAQQGGLIVPSQVMDVPLVGKNGSNFPTANSPTANSPTTNSPTTKSTTQTTTAGGGR